MNYSDGPWQPLAEGARKDRNSTKESGAAVVGYWRWGWSWWILGVVGVVVFV